MKALTTYSFAIATAVATFLLLLVGGLVNPTGSSLACPDWPLCFGSAFPEMVGGILYEHSHRLLATGVGVMTIVLAFLLYRLRGRDKALGWLGFAALGMIVLQGVLGGLTVLLKLPPQISIAHLALSMIFFLFLVYVTVRVRRLTTPREPLPVAASARRWLVIAFVLVYAQIVLGAVVRHTHAALSCLNEIPLCFGQVFPEHAHYTAHIHMAHRLLGVVVGLAVFYAAARAWSSLSGRVRWLAAAAPVLVVLQIVGSSRVDLQACKLEYSIVSPK